MKNLLSYNKQKLEGLVVYRGMRVGKPPFCFISLVHLSLLDSHSKNDL